MWGWLEPLLKVLLAFLERRASSPNTLDDANTPPDLRDRWSAYLKRRMREQDNRD